MHAGPSGANGSWAPSTCVFKFITHICVCVHSFVCLRMIALSTRWPDSPQPHPPVPCRAPNHSNYVAIHAHFSSCRLLYSLLALSL